MGCPDHKIDLGSQKKRKKKDINFGIILCIEIMINDKLYV